MPEGFPWQVSTQQHNSNWIWVDDLDEFQDSFDLSEYTAYQEKLAFAKQQTEWREFGEDLAIVAIDAIGARNLELEALGTPADTTQLLQQMGAVKELLKAGSLKTARNLCLYLAPQFPQYNAIIQDVADRLTTFIQG